MKSTIGERIKNSRKALRLTQCELALLVGIKQQSIQSLEAGKTKQTRHVVALAKALKCDPEWLQTGRSRKG